MKILGFLAELLLKLPSGILTRILQENLKSYRGIFGGNYRGISEEIDAKLLKETVQKILKGIF